MVKMTIGTAAALAAMAVFGTSAAFAQDGRFYERGWIGHHGQHHGWQGDHGFNRGWGGWDRGVRRGYIDPRSTGSLGCRMITIQKQDPWGRVETKRIQKCG